MNALFEAVYADPADDAKRLVLADALGNAPRGEFIRLQFARAAGQGHKRNKCFFVLTKGTELMQVNVR